MNDLRRMFAPLAAALLLAACTRVGGTPGEPGGSGGGARHPWTIPGTLRVALSTSPNTLNPILSTQQIESTLYSLVLDPLVATGPDGVDVPILAQTVPTLANGGISRDGLTITYRLRRNVKWQDGAPFSSRDVKFTWQAIMNPNTAVATRHGYDLVRAVDTPDAYTVVFHLKTRFAPAIHTFFADSDAPYDILPEHLLGKLPDLNRVAFDSHPIGTGAFKIVRWVRGDRLEFEANDGYFLGKPKLRHIVFKLIPDENTIANELRSHEIDAYLTATPRIYPDLKSIEGISLRLVPFNGYDSIMIDTVKPVLADVRVRRAIALAIDKRELVDKITFGTTLPATEDLPSFMWAYDPHAGSTTADPARARALLDAAGWKVGADGIRTRGGQRLALGLAFRSDSITDRERSVVLASMLRAAGIDIDLKGYTTALLYGPVEEHGVLSSGNYDLGLQTWYAGVDPDDSSQMLCSEVAPKGYNWSRICDPKLDAAEHVALENYDEASRKAAYATVQQILADRVPEVFLWWPRQIEAVNDDLKNFRPNGIVETWNAWQWSI